MTVKLSEPMCEALAIVPSEWSNPPYRFRFRGQCLDSPMFHRTFDALKKRKLVEWRGGAGTWEWRATPASAMAGGGL